MSDKQFDSKNKPKVLRGFLPGGRAKNDLSQGLVDSFCKALNLNTMKCRPTQNIKKSTEVHPTFKMKQVVGVSGRGRVNRAI